MARLLYVALAAALGACGTEEDQRPATLEVVTLTVLAPNCGQVQCHSTTTKIEGYAFDTVDDARDAMIELNVDLAIAEADPLDTELMDVLLGANGSPQMPPDSPLADQDITLIRTWLLAGAPGL